MHPTRRVQERTSRCARPGELGFVDLASAGILFVLVGQFSLLGEETSMSKDAQERIVFTEEAKKKFDECVAALAACGFGPDGPSVETTFAEIEGFGHELGKMLARALDERLTQQHAAHFQGAAACPGCGTSCPVMESAKPRDVQTTDGKVPLREPLCHCPVCHRDFFPSACRTED